MFRSFISNMQMTKVNFTGNAQTWANNREGEGYVEEILDRFFVSHDWLYNSPKAIVHHIQKQSSDHYLVLFKDQLDKLGFTKRFYFDKRFLDLVDFERTVEQDWFTPQIGTHMFQICAKIKACRLSLLKLRNQDKMNSGSSIKDIKEKMDIL